MKTLISLALILFCSIASAHTFRVVQYSVDGVTPLILTYQNCHVNREITPYTAVVDAFCPTPPSGTTAIDVSPPADTPAIWSYTVTFVANPVAAFKPVNNTVTRMDENCRLLISSDSMQLTYLDCRH